MKKRWTKEDLAARRAYLARWNAKLRSYERIVEEPIDNVDDAEYKPIDQYRRAP